MFIRKRTQKPKNGKISVTYQAVESYRLDTKVRQRVISLGEYPNPRQALQYAMRCLKNSERCYKYPLSKWVVTKCSPMNQPYSVKMTEKQAMKRRNYWRKIYQDNLKWMGKLESVVSKYPEIKYENDTTIENFLEKRKMADANERELKKLSAVNNRNR